MIDIEKKPVVGFVGFGEVNTPRELIVDRAGAVAARLEQAGLELVKAAPVSDDPEGAEAARAVSELKGSEFDALVICVAGWIPSWAVFAVIEKFKHKPMVLLGLTGWQDGDRFVTTADQAGSTALRMPMSEMGYRFKYVVTRRGEDVPVDKVVSYCRAASAAECLKNARIGMAGYRDMGLYGTGYDPMVLKGCTGTEIEHFDLLDVNQLMDSLDEKQMAELTGAIMERWDFVKAPQEGTVENSVRLYLALRAKIEKRGYDGFSFVDVDGIKRLMGFAPAGAMTLLHDEMSIPTVPENDALGAVTQLMVRYVTGQAAAYLEFYEFMDNGAMMGVPDYVPREIVDGKVTVMPNAFGSFGEGLLNVSKLKTGKVTIARLGVSGKSHRLHIMTGEARAPIPWEEAGWAPPAPQLPSLDVIFDGCTDEFIGKVMGQHYIISYGDNRAALEDLCAILGIEIV